MSIQNRTFMPHALLCYISITLSTTLLCLLSRHFIADSQFTIDFENLLDFPLNSYLYLGFIIGLALLNFSFSVFINKIIKKQNLTVNKRLAYFSLSSLTVLPLLILQPFEISILWSFLGLTLYTLAVDLFINPKEKNLTWLIAWIAVISGGMSIVLFDG